MARESPRAGTRPASHADGPGATGSRNVAPQRARRLDRDTALDWAAGGAVLAVYAAVQLAFLQGPQPFDPAIYFAAAVELQDVPADLWTLRIGLVAPVRAAVVLLGTSEAALFAVPIAVGLILAGAVYGTTLVLFRDRLLAVAAALVTVLNPYYLQRSSSIFPDTAATATFTAGFLCLVLATARSKREAAGWAPTALAVAAGFFFGWTYLIREFSLVLAPAVLAAFFLMRYPLRRVAAVVGAALATACLEFLYGWLRYGDPFVHARLLLGRGDAAREGQEAARVERVDEQLDNVLDTIVVFPRLLLTWSVGWVFIVLVAVFAVALVVRFRDRRLWLLAVWCFGFWIVMAFLGLASPSAQNWLDITGMRYWLPILPALAMGAFGGVGLLVPERVRLVGGLSLAHAATAALAAIALAPGLVEFRNCSSTGVWAHDPIERWSDLRSWFATPEAERYDVVWTDRKTRRLVLAFTSTTFGDRLWDGTVNEFVDLRNIAPPSDRQGSVILVHKDRLSNDVLTGAGLAALRREWSPIFLSRDEDMVLLAKRSLSGAGDAAGGQAWWGLTNNPTVAAEPGSCGLRPY
jgi:hypothetical protein